MPTPTTSLVRSPQKVSSLRFFFELDLSNNKFAGAFPMEVLGATQLTFLDLRSRRALFINNNNFIGSIPDNLGSTPVLYLTLANNKLVGPIPRSIGRASKTLVEVLFLNNQLSGCLPYEIGLLKIATVFDVGFNQLTGPIPHSFACLDKMQELNLAQNQFYGPVPEMVCTLRNLVNLSLSYNYFTQVGPECRKLIKSNRLDVRMNCILDLPKQRSAAECAAFFSKPRNCPDEKSFSFIPCWKSVQPNSLEPSDRRSMAPVAPPMSYGSLIPHRL
ncbi:leucine-rich repeat (LRR) family protein [Actinidia rufa]|uniref:Leucine-rich repeat (LRR) family protein n=1 Tax=Actinidia rufa TaxID=165716 RepID=A0A7J0ET63_9ERIC|nr:leucine-rich repeat (LRR) family protein [Actinidia rufa]